MTGAIHEIATRGVFQPTTDPVKLAASHVQLDGLTGGSAEHDLFQALTSTEGYCAAEVVGPSGSGKSSMIMSVVADVAQVSNRHEVLMLDAGVAGHELATESAFAGHLLERLRRQDWRFSDETIREALRTLGSSTRVEQGPQVTHTSRGEGGVPVAKVSYQFALAERSERHEFASNAARAEADLRDAVNAVRREGFRPVVVIDDTDKFADAQGLADEPSVTNLFTHAVRLLDGLHIDFVIAVHPHFRVTPAYVAAAGRILRTRAAVPVLRADRKPMPAILDGICAPRAFRPQPTMSSVEEPPTFSPAFTPETTATCAMSSMSRTKPPPVPATRAPSASNSNISAKPSTKRLAPDSIRVSAATRCLPAVSSSDNRKYR